MAGGSAALDRRLASTRVFPATAVVLLATSAALWLPVLRSPEALPSSQRMVIGALLLALAFVACELWPLRVEVRRETLMVSLSEFPLVIGLLLLPPWTVGAVNMAAGMLVYLARRDRWRDGLLNVALIALETGAAAAVLLALRGTVSTMDAVDVRYLPVAVGVLAGALLSAFAVGFAYQLIGSAESLIRIVTRSFSAAVAIVGFALAGLIVWNSSPVGPVLCVVPVVVLALLYRTYSTFLRQHADLALMYHFGRSVTAVGGDVAGWIGLIEQARDLLGARVAVLHLTDRPGGEQVLAVGPDGPRQEWWPAAGDPLLGVAERTGVARASTDGACDEETRTSLAARGATDVLLVALNHGQRDRGHLEVRDRRARWGHFTEDDLRVLETLGGQIGAALDNLRLVETLRHEAYHDTVTGLLNRLGLSMRLAEMAVAGERAGLLLVRLNVLTDVDRAMGHERGEQLLVSAGERLRAVAGPTGVVGRIEADQFAVIFVSTDEEAAMVTGRSVLRSLGRSYSVDGIDVEPHLNAGIALDTQPAEVEADSESLLQRAEMALSASYANRNQLQVYRPALGEVYRRRFQLVTQFRRAVETGNVMVHYQPKLNLTERELVGVEALVRWQHPEYGMISPDEFVKAIEPTVSIDLLFGHVLDTSLAQAAQWLMRGMRIGVAVNLSMRNLLAADFPATVAAAIQRHEVPAELLTLEITESSVMADPEHSLPVLRDLHALGVQLSVDDFGTGYSSLAYLRRLPIDEIKIDRSFVQGMVTDFGDLAIVRAIIDLGHSLGLRVIAEGVEEEAGRDALRSMRCDGMQGFLLSRPLPIDRFDAWLSSRTVPVAPADARTAVRRVLG